MVTPHVPTAMVNLNVRIAPDLYAEVAQVGLASNRYGGRHGRADLQGATAKLLALGLAAHKDAEKRKREEEGPHGPLFKGNGKPAAAAAAAGLPAKGKSKGKPAARKPAARKPAARKVRKGPSK